MPHVYAPDEETLFRGFGWAMAESHADLLLELYAKSRGRAAAIEGGREAIASDRRVRTLGIPGRAAEWYAAQTPEERRRLDAFVAGINDWARANPDRVADRLEPILPVTGADVLGHLQRVVHFTFLTAPWDAAGRLGATPGAFSGGSNAWAIGPDRAGGGHAILLANPHLPWSPPFLFFEAHLVAPGIDVSGATLVGFPILAIGFNDRLGWTHTVNPIDGADLYELTLAEGGYRWNGETRAFESRTDTLRIREPDGDVRTETFEVRSSVHGPVMAEQGDGAFALRVAGLDQPHLLGQYWDMARATSRGEFEEALSRLQLPMFNVVYADRQGEILYVFNGRVPVRQGGEWEEWVGMVPGDTSATLWTDTHPYEDLPRLRDPDTGWVQNGNDPPWTATWPQALEPADFPPYLTPHGTGFRPQRSIGTLREDERISFEEVIAYKHATRSELADRLLDDLLPLARGSGRPELERAAAVLESWDRRFDAASRGAVLFFLFVRELTPRFGSLQNAFARPWSSEAPLTTPDGVADSARTVDALLEAADMAERGYGAIDVSWGEIFRLQVDTLDLPASGVSDPFGALRVVGYAPLRDGRFRSAFGDSYIAAIEFSDPVRAAGLLTYGNASRSGAPHRTEQLRLYAEGRLRPIWRDREEIEANLERRETLPR